MLYVITRNRLFSWLAIISRWGPYWAVPNVPNFINLPSLSVINPNRKRGHECRLMTPGPSTVLIDWLLPIMRKVWSFFFHSVSWLFDFVLRMYCNKWIMFITLTGLRSWLRQSKIDMLSSKSVFSFSKPLIPLGSNQFYPVLRWHSPLFGIYCCVLFIRNWKFKRKCPSVLVKHITWDFFFYRVLLYISATYPEKYTSKWIQFLT